MILMTVPTEPDCEAEAQALAIEQAAFEEAYEQTFGFSWIEYAETERPEYMADGNVWR